MDPSTTATHVSVRTREGLVTFRRAGISFTREPTVVALGELTDEQRTQLLGETQLVVEKIPSGDDRIKAYRPRAAAPGTDYPAPDRPAPAPQTAYTPQQVAVPDGAEGESASRGELAKGSSKADMPRADRSSPIPQPSHDDDEKRRRR